MQLKRRDLGEAGKERKKERKRQIFMNRHDAVWYTEYKLFLSDANPDLEPYNNYNVL